jgi:DNA-binding NarL/FixJ family response regulator
MRIVIADDSTTVRQRLAQLVNEIVGVDVVGQARDTPEALEMVQQLEPDVAILDVRMPHGSGADLVQVLKELKQDIKIIMLTSHPYPEVRAKCISCGADYFFDKSIEFPKVNSALKNLMKAMREKSVTLNVDLMRLSETDLEKAIAAHCSTFGTVKKVGLHLCRNSPLARPFAMVSMETEEQTAKVASAFGRPVLGESAIIFLQQG